ncbi:hypothetical protein H2248_004618 [Termitomyces sp. 'cryptogamus']|nr:hypothetical protein H2248_004618 [Termitomyces sp. 'cryptogamus']
MLALCSFYPFTITTNWARTIFGQLFVMRLLNFSISKKSSLPPSISPAFAGRSRMRATISVRQSPPPSRSGSGSCPTVSPAASQSRDILRLLEKHNIHDIDVAYRESVARPLTGSKLFAPVNNIHPLKDVIDPITTALSLPTLA